MATAHVGSAHPLYLDPEAAQARLERAPEGFMRDCTRALSIKHADKIGVTLITLDVAMKASSRPRITWKKR